ncbi:MAG TPA: penicillin-insensitive murein endopeptidase [Nannocystis sp.]|jgi:LysM repeat protein/murein endopeptidase
MPAQRPHTRLPGRTDRLLGVLGLWLALLLTGAFSLSQVPEAAAASSKKKTSKKKKSKKKSRKRPVASKPAPVLPVSREVDNTWGVTSGGEILEDEAEGDAEEDADTDDSTPQSELDAIERELLANPPAPEMVKIELPPVVSDPRPIDRKPGSVKHEVIPGETLEEIAERYKVSRDDIIRWNHLDKKKPKLPLPGKTLRIVTADAPLPRERVEHVAKRGETFESVAKEYGVEVEKLKRWNKKAGKKVVAKKKLVVWREAPPLPPPLSGTGLAAKLQQLRVPSGGISIGKPSRGRLVRGVPLPERPDLYVRRKPDESYGSSHAIAELMAAIATFRHQTGFGRSIVIGGISRARGGRFRPHKSHQSGRDIDIRMPLTAAAEGKRHITANDIDWKATWQLMRTFIDRGQIEYIFLDFGLQKRIYKVAREQGATKEQLEHWLQWPVRKPKHQIIRHVEGHKVHFHVRVRCADNEKGCVTAR